MTEEHDTNRLCPNDTLKILLPAKQIPHGSTVMKRTGHYQLTLSHEIRIFVPNKQEEMQPQFIKGFFLQGAPQADLNQIAGDTELLWVTTAEYFMDYLEKIWEPTPQ